MNKLYLGTRIFYQINERADTMLMNEEHEFLYDYSDVGIPKSVTLSSYTSRMEKLRVSSDNLHQAMIKHILPQVIEPKINVQNLYEPDYFLLLRHLRILTWGPFWTAQSWVCRDCLNENGTTGQLHTTPQRINLNTVGVLRPDKGEDLKKSFVISPKEFICTDAEVKMHLNRCKDMLFYTAKVDDADEDFRALAAAISSVSDVDFIDISEAAAWLGGLPAVDEQIIENRYKEEFSVGLQSRVEFTCPVCGGRAWAYVPINDYYFRPTEEDLKEWKALLANSKK